MGGKARFDLSVPQVAGGALAATTAAFAASFFGVAGTIIGAAVVSVASTVGSAIYTHYLHRTRDRLKDVQQIIVRTTTAGGDDPPKEVPGEGGLATAAHSTVRDGAPGEDPPAPAGGPVGPHTPAGAAGGPATVGAPAPGGAPEGSPAMDGAPGRPPARDGIAGEASAGGDGTGEAEVETAAHELPPARSEDVVEAAGARLPAAPPDVRGRNRRRWVVAAAGAVATFALAMGAITLIETLTGQPLASTVHGEQGTGTTLGGGTRSTTVPADLTPAPKTTATADETTSPVPRPTPTGTVSTSAPGTSAPATSAPATSDPATPEPTRPDGGGASSAPAPTGEQSVPERTAGEQGTQQEPAEE